MDAPSKYMVAVYELINQLGSKLPEIVNLFGSLYPVWYVPHVGVIRNNSLGYGDDFYWTNTTGRTVTVSYLIQLYGTESSYCYCSIYVGPGTDYSQPVVFNECGNRYYNGSFNVPNGYILHVSNQKNIKCTILQLTGN